MKIGIQLPHGGETASPEAIADAATRAEQIGLDSVWVAERLPRTNRRIPFRGRPPGPMPKSFSPTPLETQFRALTEIRGGAP